MSPIPTPFTYCLASRHATGESGNPIIFGVALTICQQSSDVGPEFHHLSLTILDLPNELLINIVDLLPTEDLFSIIILSRRLHCLAITLLLSRYDLHSPEKGGSLYISKHKAILALNLWRRSLVFECPRLLSIHLQVDDTKACRLLSRFFTSLQGVNGIHSIEVRLDEIPDPAFVDVLDALCVTNVVSLTIDHRSNNICKTVMPSKIKRRPTLLPNLRAFQPHAALLFNMPYARWTLETINCSKISELSLVTPGLISPSWNNVLGRLNVPSLHILRVEGELSQAVLNRFLFRHRELQELHIGYHSDCHTVTQLQCPPPELPCLHTLSAPIPYLLRLLGDSRSKIIILAKLTVLPDVQHDDPAHFLCNLSRILAAVVDCEYLWSLKLMVPPQLAAASEDVIYGGFGFIMQDPGVHLMEVRAVILEQASQTRALREDAFSPSLLKSLPYWLQQFPMLNALQLWEDAAMDRSEDLSRVRSSCKTLSEIFIWSGGSELCWTANVEEVV
ncbi:uncharacterized protein LAESUDRAFT_756386 [Laetiporus sulphureus 93-53]|uniref:F-box domain-containing protein n=1 Tax=Laetiporus sulphureus 93-53 TaxID=1314785 RepID=A0A165FU50_9APHY|nr:uncharacterized protein LAESUDRAFT_756386 [Laetiporus sulphureus 93-53]KZT09414.1 hypothetical protein LAESUDRAFT_756386 [Laetiporus sulphureus 93-53]